LFDLGVSRVLNAQITRPARSHFKTFNGNGKFRPCWGETEFIIIYNIFTNERDSKCEV